MKEYIGQHRTATVPIMDILRDRKPTSYVGLHRKKVYTRILRKSV